MASRDASPPSKTARQQIIERAELLCHEARKELREAQMIRQGDVPYKLKLRLQGRVLNYYEALYPLRNDSNLEDWWDEVVLSDHWTAEREVERTAVDGGRDILDPLRVQTVEETVEQPVEGLDSLQQIDGKTVEREVETSDATGESTEVERRQVVLDAEILIDVSRRLDDAVAKLDMVPSTPEDLPTDEI